MLKILIILPHLGSDGVTNSTLLYMENMNRTNMDIRIGLAEHGSNLQEQIKRVQALNLQLCVFPSRSRETIQYSIALSKYLKENKIDIIHMMGNSATMAVEMLVAKCCKVPMRIAHCHNTECKYRICNFLLKPMLYRGATDLFACGVDAGKYLYGSKEFTVMPNGKEIKKFLFNPDYRQTVRTEVCAGTKKIIGHVGKFTKQKNHIFLIEIFRKLCERSDDYELWLVGEGGEKRDEVIGKIREYGLADRVKFWGFRTDVEKILSAMDVMVFPSLYEGLPHVVIEWQIAQLPCLLSDTITRECKVMDNVKYLPLNAGVDRWVDEIINIQLASRTGNQANVFEKMSKAGYDIEENARNLRAIYFQSVIKYKNAAGK